jgi:hypothetical protein
VNVLWCQTCGWLRRHDERDEPQTPGHWRYAPSDGLAFHQLDHPGHLMGFGDPGGEGSERAELALKAQALTPVEYALGAAYNRGLARGAERTKRAALEALARL